LLIAIGTAKRNSNNYTGTGVVTIKLCFTLNKTLAMTLKRKELRKKIIFCITSNKFPQANATSLVDLFLLGKSTNVIMMMIIIIIIIIIYKHVLVNSAKYNSKTKNWNIITKQL
jgi:hypothetical protein